jgi:hypothetical protein
MMRKRHSLAMLSAFVVGLGHVMPASAADIAFTRFLVPFFSGPVAGAHGSRWEIETWVHYSGETQAFIAPLAYCYSIECTELSFLPAGHSALPVHPLSGFETSGVLFHIENRYASHVMFESRIRDLTRLHESAGTEVPVVREDRMIGTSVFLLNIPRTGNFRDMLRIYALPEVANPEVEIRYYPLPDAGFGVGIDTYTVPLRTDRIRLQTFPPGFVYQFRPFVAQIGSLETFPELSEYDHMWIEIVPVTPGLRLWAFVSVTNNQTQQVTLVTPSGQ